LSWTKNAGQPQSDNYAILDALELFRDSDGKFKFKLQFEGPLIEGLEAEPLIWRQSSNPTTSKNAVSDYEPINIKCSKNHWKGLAMSAGQNTRIDGSRHGGYWYYAVMATREWTWSEGYASL
jgi:hypothetical protein